VQLCICMVQQERECEYRLDLFALILEKLYPFVDDWY